MRERCQMTFPTTTQSANSAHESGIQRKGRACVVSRTKAQKSGGKGSSSPPDVDAMDLGGDGVTPLGSGARAGGSGVRSARWPLSFPSGR